MAFLALWLYDGGRNQSILEDIAYLFQSSVAKAIYRNKEVIMNLIENKLRNPSRKTSKRTFLLREKE